MALLNVVLILLIPSVISEASYVFTLRPRVQLTLTDVRHIEDVYGSNPSDAAVVVIVMNSIVLLLLLLGGIVECLFSMEGGTFSREMRESASIGCCWLIRVVETSWKQRLLLVGTHICLFPLQWVQSSLSKELPCVWSLIPWANSDIRVFIQSITSLLTEQTSLMCLALRRFIRYTVFLYERLFQTNLPLHWDSWLLIG